MVVLEGAGQGRVSGGPGGARQGRVSDGPGGAGQGKWWSRDVVIQWTSWGPYLLDSEAAAIVLWLLICDTLRKYQLIQITDHALFPLRQIS